VSASLGLVFPCPVCRGPLAFWVLQPQFTCHHCHWALSSNVRVARVRAVVVAVVFELLLLAALLAALPRGISSAAVWSAAGGVLGFCGGWVALKLSVSLLPLRPPM
jgi:hypothetical protein